MKRQTLFSLTCAAVVGMTLTATQPVRGDELGAINVSGEVFDLIDQSGGGKSDSGKFLYSISQTSREEKQQAKDADGNLLYIDPRVERGKPGWLTSRSSHQEGNLTVTHAPYMTNVTIYTCHCRYKDIACTYNKHGHKTVTKEHEGTYDYDMGSDNKRCGKHQTFKKTCDVERLESVNVRGVVLNSCPPPTGAGITWPQGRIQ